MYLHFVGMVFFKVIFYTKGCFVKNRLLKYEGGDGYAFNGQDSECWSFFDACDLIKSMEPGFDYSSVRMWWKHVEGTIENDLKPFNDDGDAFEIAAFIHECKPEIEIYSEQLPSNGAATFMENVRKRKKGKQCEEVIDNCSGDDGSSDESVKDVKFEDSEEERMNPFDDGFDEGFNDHPDNVPGDDVAGPDNVPGDD